MARLNEIMSAEIKAVSPELSLRELAEFFVAEEVSGAPVISGGRVLGVVSATDLLEFDAESRAVPAYEDTAEGSASPLRPDDSWRAEEGDAPARYFAEFWEDAGADLRTRFTTDSPEWNALENHSVGEVMTRNLLSLPPGTEVREAARLMIDSDVHRVLVMDGEDLVGIVTTTDIIRAVADRGLASEG